MESNARYYARRAAEELRAAERAITAEGRARRYALAELFASKAKGCQAESAVQERLMNPAELESATC